MFLGTFQHAVDEKGRLFLPAKFRGEGDGGPAFIVTQGLERCLYLYPAGAFQAIVGRIDPGEIKNKGDVRAFKRMLLSGAGEAVPDEMGRVLLPRPLLAYAGIKKEVTILGVGERIELWATNTWTTYNRKALGAFQRVGARLEL